MILRKTVFPNIFLLIICAFLTGCGKSEPIVKSGFYFDTIISVTLYDNSKAAQLEHCMELAEMYEHYFSTKIADSDISKINASVNTPVTVHDETIELLEKGLYYSKLSSGKFDVTIGKLTSLWDFQAAQPAVPDSNAIKAAVSAIDYKKIEINGNEVMLTDADAALDLGGIAKGFIADKMKEYLVSEGITSGLINLGGNVLTIGRKTDGGSYTIGIQRPFDETGAAIASVQIEDQTVVTSGIYERYFEIKGGRYHHILDVDTGYPFDNGLISVSIICHNSVDGDGLSTDCFAMGLEKGMELIESLDNTEAIFITSDHEMHCSSGIGTSIPMQKL